MAAATQPAQARTPWLDAVIVQGTALAVALGVALAIALVALAFASWSLKERLART